MYFQNLRKQNYISSATKKKEDKLTKKYGLWEGMDISYLCKRQKI